MLIYSINIFNNNFAKPNVINKPLNEGNYYILF